MASATVADTPTSAGSTGVKRQTPPSRSGSCGPIVVLMKHKLALVAFQIAVLAAVFVWIGGPGPYFAVGLAMVAWRYFLWGDRD
jgi:hypothetical protein